MHYFDYNHKKLNKEVSWNRIYDPLQWLLQHYF